MRAAPPSVVIDHVTNELKPIGNDIEPSFNTNEQNNDVESNYVVERRYLLWHPATLLQKGASENE